MTAASWIVDLELDGDDDTTIAADNAEAEIKALLRILLAANEIRGWTIERREP